MRYSVSLMLFLLASLVASLSVATHATAVVILLDAVQDNTLYEDETGRLSNGSGQHLFVGRSGQNRRQRGLVLFDIARAIPEGSIINGVQLHLNHSMSITPSGTVSLHKVLTLWGEGMSIAHSGEGGGAPATPGDATWIHTRFDTDMWQTPGGDFTASPSASLMISNLGEQRWGPTLEMIGDVQAWLETPATNFGWLLFSENEAMQRSSLRFDTHEHPDVQVRPLLRIDFTPPLPPLSISPPSGTYVTTQVVDLILLVNAPGQTIVGKTIWLNGNDVTEEFGPCFDRTPGTLTAGGQTFRCSNPLRPAPVVGVQTFSVTLALSDGSEVQDTVTWNILDNTEP